MSVNVSKTVGALLDKGLRMKEFALHAGQIEHHSGKKADYRLVIDLLAAMGMRIVLDGDTFKTAPILSNVHSNVPPSFTDNAFKYLPYAERRPVGKYRLLPAYAEKHIPIKIDAWLKVGKDMWFPVMLYRAMVSVAALHDNSQWCSRVYSTVNLPVIDLNGTEPALCLLRVPAPTAAEIYAQQSVSFTLTDVNKGRVRKERATNRFEVQGIECENFSMPQLHAQFAEAFPAIQEAFSVEAELSIGEAIRLRKVIHYASQDIQHVQDRILKAVQA